MAKYLLIEYEDDEVADAVVDTIRSGDSEDSVHVRGVYKKPTKFCDDTCYEPTDPERQKTARGSKFGWYVCRKCHKPRVHSHQRPINDLERGAQDLREMFNTRTQFSLTIMPAKKKRSDGSIIDWTD